MVSHGFSFEMCSVDDEPKRFRESATGITDTTGSGFQVRLKPLNEFRALVEERGKFIMIQGEEITDSAEGRPVHLNATNLKSLIRPLLDIGEPINRSGRESPHLSQRLVGYWRIRTLTDCSSLRPTHCHYSQ